MIRDSNMSAMIVDDNSYSMVFAGDGSFDSHYKSTRQPVLEHTFDVFFTFESAFKRYSSDRAHQIGCVFLSETKTI